MTLEFGGDKYTSRVDAGGGADWLRLSQDGSLLGYATKRESRLLDHIVEVEASLERCIEDGN